MKNRLDIEQQEAQIEKCAKILDMIKYNRRYLFSTISESTKELYISLYGKEYYRQKIEERKKIQNRLICYYAKQVAILSSQPYEVALEIKQTQLSNQ